ncbi:N-acetylglucosaminyl-phosphatidylinositol de-N-acetylase, a glycan bosynthesis protein [Trichoderma virens Gv29-8]|uniref:N-acetylglucosaminylphosphatidylinositol deacetylase n=1 Tax=Hypocrea virens (strain Gv29-8 / FGSC 10586) TaxID=413071 RepID=G9N037_HYPVG|nr:N-acetylglucosaminyl-phosphatidylinositol de-N-acetylase, a glycan bosynthesis protein [Trichoderma virens Gv29-8]EHK19719.1 N-acetylglucosaminyl-phosphatidylinositol de-N-acetylase, a glycan bosynthesis protein [Trichoderma virens Gv29-8]
MARKIRDTKVFKACYWFVGTRSRRRTLLRVALVILIVPLVLQWFLAYIVGSDARLLPPELLQSKNLLVVTAHPDDECLFFSPTILGILDRNHAINGGLLVMSTGNNYGKGETRKQELKGSCHALGINPSRCEAMNHPSLQDNPRVWWDTNLIQAIVREYVKKWEVDAIITFDEGGVSGHINHRAVSAAVSEYVLGDKDAPPAYKLVTTAVLRKYTFLFDLPLTALSFTWRIICAAFYPSAKGSPEISSKALLANSWHRYVMTRGAFASHDSQYSWDRHLYMILSRYVWFNDLKRIPTQIASSS